MRSKAGSELLPYCAVLTFGFSSKPKASVCCSSPHLKLVPPLTRCHQESHLPWAGVVHLFHVIIQRGRFSCRCWLSGPSNMVLFCLSQSCSPRVDLWTSRCLVRAVLVSPWLYFKTVFSLPWFGKRISENGGRKEVLNNPEGAVFNISNFNSSIKKLVEFDNGQL